MKELTIVSLDSHAQPPPEVWPEYLEKRFHEFLPALLEENRWYTALVGGFADLMYNASKLVDFDLEGAVAGGGAKG